MNTELQVRVVNCIAETTRYPRELLVGNADLESDLGIDSVKRIEIVAALAEEFGLDLHSEERDTNIRTIDDVTEWIGSLASDSLAGHSPADRSRADRSPADHSPVDRLPVGRLSTNHGDAALLKEGLPSYTASPARAVAQPSSKTEAIPAFQPQTAQISHISTAHSRGAPQPKYIKSREPSLPSTHGKDGSLAGRIALVTGSGRGVGKTIARVLASRGATVVINSFHSRDEGEKTATDIIANGGQAVHAWGSVANPDHVERIFAEVQERYGALDILVCNASDGRIGPFSELTPDDWDRAFRTNVSGHHQCAIRAARLMQHRGGGSIVTMSAVGAHRFIDGLGSQGVVKAAVETLTKYLACELARFGVRTNCVCGGPVYGDLLSKFPAAEVTQQHWEAMTPGGALSSPMDLAHTIAFLVSDEACGINGAVWPVDQGFSAIADGRPLNGLPKRVSTMSTF